MTADSISPDHSVPATPNAYPSGLIRRLAGLVYDLVAVVAIVMVVGMICEAATLGKLQHLGPHDSVPIWYQALQYLVVVTYFVFSWRRGDQTLGMRPWRMRLRQADGRKITLKIALTRAGAASLPLLGLAFGPWLGIRDALWITVLGWVVFYAAALFDRADHRALHDLMAGTIIVHTDPPPRRRQAKRRK